LHFFYLLSWPLSH